MKIFKAVILLCLLLIHQSNAQIGGGKISVKSIRSVSRSAKYLKEKKEYEKKAGVEIELETEDERGFYIGALAWFLRIGNLECIGEGGSKGRISNSNRTIFFVIPKSEWKKLKQDEPLRLSWGCPKYQDTRKGKIFANLDKKMLDNKQVKDK